MTPYTNKWFEIKRDGAFLSCELAYYNHWCLTTLYQGNGSQIPYWVYDVNVHDKNIIKNAFVSMEM